MMRIIIVVAAKSELLPLFESFSTGENEWFTINNHEVKIVVTGVGQVCTTYRLTKELTENKIDLVINAGIAGSYHPGFPVGAVVNVVSEQFSDLGIDDNGAFRSLFQLGLADPDEFPFEGGVLVNNNVIYNGFPGVKGITSEQAHGSSESIERIKKRYYPDVETMEGAAVFLVCLHEKVRFMEIRSISNRVEPRDLKKWDIPRAVKNLAGAIIKVINSI